MAQLKQLLRAAIAYPEPEPELEVLETPEQAELRGLREAELVQDLDTHENALEILRESQATLECIRVALESSLAAGGLSTSETRYFNIAVESAYGKLGIPYNALSMESFTADSRGSTEIALEGITDTLQKVGSKIWELIQKLFEKLSEFMDFVLEKLGIKKTRFYNRVQHYKKVLQMCIGMPAFNEKHLSEPQSIPSLGNDHIARFMSSEPGKYEWDVDRGLQNIERSYQSIKPNLHVIEEMLNQLVNGHYTNVDLKKLMVFQHAKFCGDTHFSGDADRPTSIKLDITVQQLPPDLTTEYHFSRIDDDMIDKLTEAFDETYDLAVHFVKQVNNSKRFTVPSGVNSEGQSVANVYKVAFAFTRSMANYFNEMADNPARLINLMQAAITPENSREHGKNYTGGHANEVRKMYWFSPV